MFNDWTPPPRYPNCFPILSLNCFLMRSLYVYRKSWSERRYCGNSSFAEGLKVLNHYMSCSIDFWLKLNQPSPKVNWYTNNSEIKDPSINTFQVISVSIVSDSCARGLGSILTEATISFFGNHLTQSWQICQNDAEDENLDLITVV